MAIAPGLRGQATLTVGAADTARALGSGSLDVLGTPRLVALTEEATCAAADPHLEPGSTTVGTRVDVEHLRPSAVGTTVTANAELVEVIGRRLTFAVTVVDDQGPIGQGTVQRVVVDVARFLAR